MKKSEWLNILAYHKNMFQLEHLPDAGYVAAMYEELKNYDARFVAYAVNRIAHTESTSFNRYPLLAQINQNLPDFSYERRELADKAARLKRLLSERYRSGHVFYDMTKKEIRNLSYFFTGVEKENITPEEIDTAVEIKLGNAIDQFFNAPTIKQISQIKDKK